MENEFAKKDWITRLWEETRGDEATRGFLFGSVIEDMKARAAKMADEREDEIRDEVRDEIEKDLMEDPPEHLRAKVIRGLIEYPPSGMDESLESWKELKAQIRDEAREDFEDEMGDLKLTIETLREEIAGLKGEESPEPGESEAPKKGKVRR